VNIYGLSEVIGPGVSNECVEEQRGAHIFEDHFLVEVVDPQSGQPLPPGERGELVFTTLTKEAVPVIRYRTGDLAWLIDEPCRCGRTHVRMSRVVGRTDDMLIIRGINVFPSQVEAALGTVPDLTPHYRLVVTRDTLDELEVQVEVGEAFLQRAGGALAPDAPAVQALRRRVEETLFGVLALHTRVTLMPPGTLPRSEGGKLRRVDDRRGRIA
jgi:phenylacetate-CoA ligase